MKYIKLLESYKSRAILFLIWAIVSIIAVCHHEIWRDEMRALSLATLHNSYFELINDLKNEGHPLLWYFILKISYTIYSDPVILKISAYIIGLASSYLLFFYLRLPILVSILYVFSVFMMWENTIMCRNYGISSLLVILFAICNDRNKYIYCLLILALLVQTNIIGAIVSLCLFLVLIYTLFQSKIQFNKFAILAASSVYFCSFLLFYSITKIDSNSIFHKGLLFSPHGLMKSIIYPCDILSCFLDGYPLLSVIIIFVLYLNFLQHRVLAILFFMACILVNYIDTAIYPLSVRHIGVFCMFYVILIHFKNSNSLFTSSYQLNLHPRFHLIVNLIMGIFLLALFNLNIQKCVDDITREVTRSKALATYIQSNKQYKNAVLISEPDFYIEALPYYISNKIYFPRESKYGTYSHFTLDNRHQLDFKKITDLKDSLTRIDSANTVLLITKDCDFSYPDMKKDFLVYVTKTLNWTKKDLTRIKKLIEFKQDIGDEHYTLYEIR